MSNPPPPPNPYQSPTAGPIMPVGGGQAQMDYMRAYNFVFENPDWMTTVLMLGLISLTAFIPGVSILLNLLYLGYQFQVIDSLLLTQGRQYPTFDFGKFGDYLGRGLWPFLVNLVVSLVMIPVFLMMMFCSGLIAPALASVAGEEAGTVIGLVIGAIIFFVFFAALILLMYVMVAMIIRSGLAQDFGSAFQFDWIKDFIGKMWLEMTLAGLFFGISSMVLGFVGLLACVIGLLFVAPIILLAYAHLLYQLYMIYLSRGGMPVPMKMMAVPVPVPPGKFPPA